MLARSKAKNQLAGKLILAVERVYKTAENLRNPILAPAGVGLTHFLVAPPSGWEKVRNCGRREMYQYPYVARYFDTKFLALSFATERL